MKDLFESVYRRTHRTKISLCTSFAMGALYILAISLWIIDVRNVITEVRLTLLSNSGDSLDDLYGVALTSVLRLVSVQDVLYAFMVSGPSYPCSSRSNGFCRLTSATA